MTVQEFVQQYMPIRMADEFEKFREARHTLSKDDEWRFDASLDHAFIWEHTDSGQSYWQTIYENMAPTNSNHELDSLREWLYQFEEKTYGIEMTWLPQN